MLLVAAVSVTTGQSIAEDQQRTTNNRTVQVEMRNVMYHFTEQVGIHIRQLEGTLVPARESGLPVFDDPRSFSLAINSAEISMSAGALSNVLNQQVFAAADAPIKDVVVTIQGDLLKVRGKWHSEGNIPFATEGTIAPTPDGQIRIQARKIKAAKLSVKGLMDLLGLKIADLINTKKVAGVRTEKDDLILDPQQILPPPQVQGRVTAIRLAGDQIIQTFGDQRSGKPVTKLGANYMAYRGAQLRFGKLTMSDTDMILIDMDSKDPFDFYLEHYKEQLVAGYSKETLDFGLRVYMRDFNKLQRQALGKTEAAVRTRNASR
jgi:hypothetical protein